MSFDSSPKVVAHRQKKKIYTKPTNRKKCLLTLFYNRYQIQHTHTHSKMYVYISIEETQIEL